MAASPSLLFLMANTLNFLCLSNHLFLLLYISSLHLTVDPFSSTNFSNSMTTWTRLPTLSPFGSRKTSLPCSGCRLPIDTSVRVHKCTFYSSGFTLNSIVFKPCRVYYHPKCVKVGAPFRTRQFGKGTNGMQYPPCATNLPFICELCTVRTHLGREPDAHCSTDMTLLMLERMRMIDAAHS